MLRRKHLVGLLVVALLVAGGGATAVLLQGDAGPFPAEDQVARTGFAAWPVDTPEEAREECAGSPDWRKTRSK